MKPLGAIIGWFLAEKCKLPLSYFEWPLVYIIIAGLPNEKFAITDKNGCNE